MKLQLEKKSSTLTILNIQVDEEEILKAKTEAQKELSKNVQVDGFRSGKVPLNIAVDYINPGTLLDNFFNRICNQLINKTFMFKTSRVIISTLSQLNWIDFLSS